MTKYGVAGSSFALVKDGRLIFAEGFGVMDRVSKDPVLSSSLFCIASISKPITSSALMMMIEKNPHLLNRKIFGPNGLLGKKYGTKRCGSYERMITLQHLLEHTAGGEAWDNHHDDPMFDTQHRWNNFTELIGWVLDRRNYLGKAISLM